jgi:hypothetical protein
MASHIGRRKFLATLGGAGVAARHAAEPATLVVGFLSSLSASVTSKRVFSFDRLMPPVGTSRTSNLDAPAVKREEEEDWGKGR